MESVSFDLELHDIADDRMTDPLDILCAAEEIGIETWTPRTEVLARFINNDIEVAH